MFKFNGKELKENIEIKKLTLEGEKFFYEKGHKIKENEIFKFNSLEFTINAKDEDKKYGISFMIDYPERLLELPIGKEVNINKLINESEAYWNLGIDEKYVYMELECVNFNIKKITEKDFLFKIDINYDYQYFKSLKTINYKLEINFKFNYDKDVIEKR